MEIAWIGRMRADHVGEVSKAHPLVLELLPHEEVRAREQLYKREYRGLPSAVLADKEIHVSNRDTRIPESPEIVNEEGVFHFAARLEDRLLLRRAVERVRALGCACP